jgi:hypothetical protein
MVRGASKPVGWLRMNRERETQGRLARPEHGCDARGGGVATRRQKGLAATRPAGRSVRPTRCAAVFALPILSR